LKPLTTLALLLSVATIPACAESALTQVRADLSTASFTGSEESVLAAETWVKGKRRDTRNQTPPMFSQCFTPPTAQASGATQRCYGFVEGRLLYRSVTYRRSAKQALELFDAVAAGYKLPAALVFTEPYPEFGCTVYAGEPGDAPRPYREGSKVHPDAQTPAAQDSLHRGRLCASATPTYTHLTMKAGEDAVYDVQLVEYTKDQAVQAARKRSNDSSSAHFQKKMRKMREQRKAREEAFGKKYPDLKR